MAKNKNKNKDQGKGKDKGGKPAVEAAEAATAPASPGTEAAAPSDHGPSHYQHDPRDERHVDLDAVNDAAHYALWAVFRLAAPLPAGEQDRASLVGESAAFVEASGVTTRGWYDVAGFRSDADLLVWWLDDDPEVLQEAYHRLRSSAMGRHLSRCGPAWGCTRPPSSTGGTCPRASAAWCRATGRWSTRSSAPTTGTSCPLRNAHA